MESQPDHTDTNTTPRQPQTKRRLWLAMSVVALLLAGAAAAVYFFTARLTVGVKFSTPNNNPLNAKKSEYNTVLKLAVADIKTGPFAKKSINATGCETLWTRNEYCSFNASVEFDPASLPKVQSQLQGRGWQDNQDKVRPNITEYNKNGDLYKVINGIRVCLSLGNSTAVIDALNCPNPSAARREAYADWERFIPEQIPSRYTLRTQEVKPYSGEVTLRFSTEPLKGTKKPFVELGEYKIPAEYTPPNNCPISLGVQSSKTSPCTLKLTTPKGRPVYVSKDYDSPDYQYEYTKIDNTLFIIREWNSNQALSDPELSQFVDSMTPITNDQLMQRLADQLQQ